MLGPYEDICVLISTIKYKLDLGLINKSDHSNYPVVMLYRRNASLNFSEAFINDPI